MSAAAAGSLITLHPGDVAAGVRGDCFETLLGSCVSIVLTDPRRTVGTMCHIVHTGRPTRGLQGPAAMADDALGRMMQLLRAQGLNPRLCEAYVFGGGNMFPQLYSGTNVGQDNVDWALRILDGLQVPVLASAVLGNVYRRVRWTVGPEDPTVLAVPV